MAPLPAVPAVRRSAPAPEVSVEADDGVIARMARAPSLQVASVAVGAFALVVILLHDPWDQPLLHDRAYFVYMAQALLRGEPLYAATTLGYAPLAALFSAAAMMAGALVGVPDYVAPRLLAVPLAAASAGLLCMAVARAASNVWTGVVAGATLTTFDQFNVLAAANLEPKILVLFLSLLAVTAAQARRWWMVGLWSSLAAMAWQPAAVVGLAMLPLVIANRERSAWRSLGEFLLGGVLGLMPVLLYLLATAQLDDFVRQAVLFKLHSRPEIVGGEAPNPLRMSLILTVAVGPPAVLVLPSAVAGVGAFIWHAVRQPISQAQGILQSSGGGLVLLTVAWMAYATVSTLTRAEGQTSSDVIPFLYLVPFWCAYAFHALANRAPGVDQRTRRRRIPLLPAVAALVGLVALGRAAAYRVRLPLEQQVRVIRHGVQDRAFLAINLPEYYAITGSRSPWRSMYITPYFMQFWERQVGISCRDLQEAIRRGRYERIFVRTESRWSSGCLPEVVRWIERRYVRLPATTGFGYDVSCGTAALLGVSHGVGASPGAREWARCALRKVVWGYQFDNSGEMLSYGRALDATPTEGRP